MNIKKLNIYTISIIVFFVIFIVLFPKVGITKNLSAERYEFSCMAKLRKIQKALWIYAQDNDIEFPETENGLQRLVDKKYLKPQDLRCPFDNYNNIGLGLYWFHKPKKVTESSYRYFPGKNVGLYTEALCQDKCDHWITGKVNVLFSTGEIKSFDGDNYQEQVKNYIEYSKYFLKYIHFYQRGKQRFSMPECIIYCYKFPDEINLNKAYILKVKPSSLNKITDILKKHLGKNRLSAKKTNNEYFAVICYLDDAINFFRFNALLLNEEFKEEIFKEIPSDEKARFKDFWDNLTKAVEND